MSKLNANAQPFMPATTRAATTDAATRHLSANAHPFRVVTAPAQHHAGIWWMMPFFVDDDDDDETDHRSLFMTFSSGSPLTKEEISDYFNRRFGLCVERAYVKNEERRDPEFGKITFIRIPNFLVENILRKRKVVKLCVNNKPIWLKKYVPRSQRRLMAERGF